MTLLSLCVSAMCASAAWLFFCRASVLRAGRSWKGGEIEADDQRLARSARRLGVRPGSSRRNRPLPLAPRLVFSGVLRRIP